MLYQLHHQSKADRRDIRFVAQKSVPDSDSLLETWSLLHVWIGEVMNAHTPAKGWDWLLVGEKSPWFLPDIELCANDREDG